MTMDFEMDQCLQLDPRKSHSLGADWIVKYITRQERNAYIPCRVFYMSNSAYTQGASSYCIRSIPGHCDLQTDI